MLESEFRPVERCVSVEWNRLSIVGAGKNKKNVGELESWRVC